MSNIDRRTSPGLAPLSLHVETGGHSTFHSTVSQWSRNVRKDVLGMFLKVDNVRAKRMSSGRLSQATELGCITNVHTFQLTFAYLHKFKKNNIGLLDGVFKAKGYYIRREYVTRFRRIRQRTLHSRVFTCTVYLVWMIRFNSEPRPQYWA